MKIRLVTIVGALAMLAAGVSYAGIPGANGTISACKDNKGVLKVIDAEAGATCNANQQLLTWNQQGSAGPQGPPGASGYVRIAVPSPTTAGRLVARVNGLRLEMAGNDAALQLTNHTAAIATYVCTGITGDTADIEPIEKRGQVLPSTTIGIIANAEDPAALTCHLVDHATNESAQVFLSGGSSANARYVGHVISDSAQ